MFKKMKICQVHPGILPIPSEKWGAVEKIIWNYKKELEKLGHICDIKYLDDINYNEYDIIHTHIGVMSAPEFSTPVSFDIIAQNRNFDYFFSLHDHHVVVNENIYELNKSVINNSISTVVHGENIMNLFYDFNYKMKFLSHGVDIEFHKPMNKDKSNHRFLCVANNGLSHDPTYDRKGFKLAIELSEFFNIPLTICGPSNNKLFFEHHNIKETELLKILYDLSDDEILEEYNKHTIFLHFSNLEAGNPNLTLLEALSCGLPVIGTCDSKEDIPGIIKTELNRDDIIQKTTNTILNYDNIQKLTQKIKIDYSWSNIVEKLECMYFSYLENKKMLDSLKTVYSDIEKNNNENIIIDYLDGPKVEILSSNTKKYNIEFINNDVSWNAEINNNMWHKLNIHYYVDWNIKINNINYKLNLENKNVLISFESSALGDTLAWIPYVEEFRKKHKCNITITTFWNKILKDSYPNLKFLQPGVELNKYYAWYKIGIFDDDETRHKNKWQTIPLQQVASDILGLEYKEMKPKIYYPNRDYRINRDYIAITTESTAKAKLWNYPNGWQILVDKIKNELNLDVVVVQKEKTYLKNVIDSTNIDIYDTINEIKNAKCFIGLGSGLSWLSWSLNIPTILISGFSEPYTEFYTPYRIHNKSVCNSCYNDPNIKFDRGDWNWCPRKNDFICTKSITPDDVFKYIQKIIK